MSRIDESFLQRVHPKFAKWYGEQKPETKAAIVEQWGKIWDDEDIKHDVSVGQHARQAVLLQWCAELYGYDFTP